MDFASARGHRENSNLLFIDHSITVADEGLPYKLFYIKIVIHHGVLIRNGIDPKACLTGEAVAAGNDGLLRSGGGG